MSCEALNIEFMQMLKGICVEDDIEFNFFELGGSGYLENPTTDLMALFMGAQKMVPPWLLKALLCCLDGSLDVDEIDFTSGINERGPNRGWEISRYSYQT